MMNISEFERTKPRVTFKKLNDLIATYESHVREIDIIMDEEDAAYKHAYTVFLEELKDLRQSFLKGE